MITTYATRVAVAVAERRVPAPQVQPVDPRRVVAARQAREGGR